MNKLDKLLIENILKKIYEKNELNKQINNNDYVKALGTKSTSSLTNIYHVVTTLPIISSLNNVNINEDNKYKQIDMKLIKTLSNLVDMYKASGNPCILNELELVLEDYINHLYDRAE